MINVEITGFVVEPNSSKSVDDGKGWAVSRALKLKNSDDGSAIAEWFYVSACNQYYYEKVAVYDHNGRGYYIQDEFDEQKLFKSACTDFEQLSFDNWDDFFEKMRNLFEYEDS